LPIYSYLARNMAGTKIVGEIEAQDINEIRLMLRDKDLFLVRADEPRDSLLSWRNRRAPGATDIAMMSRQLAILFEAGVPIVNALRVLMQQTANRPLARAIQAARQDVIDGSTLSDAMARHPDIFDDVQVTLIRVGETGGVLPEMLNRAADQLEYAAQTKRKLGSAFTYPLIVLMTAISVIVLLLMIVVPVFTGIYSRFHADLPVATQLLILASSFILRFGWMIAIAVFLIVMWARAGLRSPGARRQVDALKLRLPVFGPVFQKLAIAQFAYSLSAMIRSGVPLLTGLTVAGQVCGNTRIAESIWAAGRLISEGKSMAAAFEESAFFPPIMISVIDAGEHASKLSEMLDHLAHHFQDEVTHSMDRIARLLEPFLTGLVGILVAGVLLALYMPIFNLSRVMEK
jgi:type IV pilus assembly protein PilC